MPSLQIVTRKLPQSAVFKFLGTDADYCCDQGVIPGGALANGSKNFDIGTVLGRITTGAITVAAPAAGSGNAGDGTCILAAPAYDAAVQAGTYRAVAISPVGFEVFDPSGRLIGLAADGVAFASQVHFTISHGAAAFDPGDEWAIVVSASAASGNYVQINPTAGDGSQNFAGALFRGVTVGADDTRAVIATRGPMVVVSDNLIWPAGMSDAAKAAALAQAAAVGIKAQPFG